MLAREVPFGVRDRHPHGCSRGTWATAAAIAVAVWEYREDTMSAFCYTVIEMLVMPPPLAVYSISLLDRVLCWVERTDSGIG